MLALQFLLFHLPEKNLLEPLSICSNGKEHADLKMPNLFVHQELWHIL